jgi:hypothetical protein
VPTSHLNSKLSDQQHYQWESLFTPIENVENMVDKFLEKEVAKAIREVK